MTPDSAHALAALTHRIRSASRRVWPVDGREAMGFCTLRGASALCGAEHKRGVSRMPDDALQDKRLLERGQSYRLQQETVETRFLCNAQDVRAGATGHGD